MVMSAQTGRDSHKKSMTYWWQKKEPMNKQKGTSCFFFFLNAIYFFYVLRFTSCHVLQTLFTLFLTDWQKLILWSAAQASARCSLALTCGPVVARCRHAAKYFFVFCSIVGRD